MDEPENVVKIKEFLGKDLWNQVQDFQKRNKKFEERQELAKKILKINKMLETKIHLELTVTVKSDNGQSITIPVTDIDKGDSFAKGEGLEKTTLINYYDKLVKRYSELGEELDDN